MNEPEQQQPILGRNPNRVERWETVNLQALNPKLTSSSHQTGVWHANSDQDALKTGVWNPARQHQAAPSANIWVLLGIVTVCSLGSFAMFQSLLGPGLSGRTVNARSNPNPKSGQVGPRDLAPASGAQASTEASQVASSAVTFDAQPSLGKTKPVQPKGQNDSTQSSLTEIMPKTNTLPANQIHLEQIDSISQAGGQPVLHFRDGSSLNVDNFTLNQLPSEVRLRITYSRGRDGP